MPEVECIQALTISMVINSQDCFPASGRAGNIGSPDHVKMMFIGSSTASLDAARVSLDASGK